MARIDICISCRQLKTIRRSCGKCDKCWHKENYRTRPGIKAKMNHTSKTWRAINEDRIRDYNREYYDRHREDNKQDRGAES